MDFSEAEATDGVRFSWNVWPASRLDAQRMVIPFGAVYTPLKAIENMPVVGYQPVPCKNPQCLAILNPHCRLDFQAKLWVCPFCFTRNQLPPNYSEISETQLPAELFPNFSTIEYTLPRQPAPPCVFLFLVDLCITQDNLNALRSALEHTLTQLPEQAHVGLITFGTTVQIHELGFEHCPKSFVFRGTKEVTMEQIQDILGFAGQRRVDPSVPTSRRFILPVSECEFVFTSVLGELQVDPWPVSVEHRPLRCTGVALSAAISLLEKSFPNVGSRIMLFSGGVATAGPGSVIGVDLKEKVRSHHDLESTNENAKYSKPAHTFYATLAKRAAKNGHVIDLFCSSLDQPGIMEEIPCVEATSGSVVMTDSFKTDVFKESLKKMFTREKDQAGKDTPFLRMAFAASLRVLVSREVKICGAIGPCTTTQKAHPSVSETEIGQGGTCEWLIGAADAQTSVAIYFEIASQQQAQITDGQPRNMQFLTTYQHSSGAFRLRVTTIQQSWASGPNAMQTISSGFDQEAAAVLMARIAVFKCRAEEPFDILRWLDRSLIRLMSKFANYRKDDPSSFQVGPQFSMYPQFMFHLRRSPLLQVFNSSPDETAYYRSIMLRADVTNTLTMIQPSLVAYSFSAPPAPVVLDVTSIVPDQILLLDTFSHVVVFHGETIAKWRDANYQNQPGYENFAELLQLPVQDAQTIMADRFPHPVYIYCDHGDSKSRFLLYKLNPSRTHNNNAMGGAAVISDDVSLEVFEDHLKRLSVQD
eukprot:c20965_g1_i1.p1 GENE.c20965_g1_i1~~c20965_g1_i1.p1  ORF type:complete len:756 (-),score=160.48 c20965_g1_i1:356-2623(-)